MAVDPLTLAAPAEVNPSALQLDMRPYDAPAFAPHRAAEEAARRIQRRALPFEAGSDAPPPLVTDLLADDIRQLADSAVQTGRTARIHIVGGSDPSGNAAHNAALAARRARNVMAALMGLGIPASMFDTQVQQAGERSVRFEVEMSAK